MFHHHPSTRLFGLSCFIDDITGSIARRSELKPIHLLLVWKSEPEHLDDGVLRIYLPCKYSHHLINLLSSLYCADYRHTDRQSLLFAAYCRRPGDIGTFHSLKERSPGEKNRARVE